VKAASSPQIDTILYGVLIALASAQMSFTLYWVAMEVFGRLGLWPDALVWFDLEAFLDTESAMNLASFITFVILFTTAYILILRRQSLAFWILLLALLVGRFDWIVLALNLHFTNFFGGVVEFAAQATMLILCGALSTRGALR
jgi:FlaA1/EpsC-like NDP-sugar epimerase